MPAFCPNGRGADSTRGSETTLSASESDPANRPWADDWLGLLTAAIGPTLQTAA